MSENIRTHKGFEYRSENVTGRWHWSFRPEGAPIFVGADLPKPKFLAFLDSPEEALNHFLKALDRRSNVEKAEDDLKRAEEFHQRVQRPEWDPGGRANNPGKVSSDLQEARLSQMKIDAAQKQLVAAVILREQLQSGDFDVAAWRAKWLSN